MNKDNEGIGKNLLISCGIFEPEINLLIKRGKIKADVIFLNKYLHLDYQKLHRALDASIKKYENRKPLIVYGDLCLGFNNEMQSLMADHGVSKVNGLNCIDCLLGGHGKLLEIDPLHHFFFLTPAFLEFSEKLITGTREQNIERFSMLKGIIIVDSLGNMELYRDHIEQFGKQTGLSVVDHLRPGLSGIKNIVNETL